VNDLNSFYITGGTLRVDARCYIEREADSRLLDGLSRGEFCYVLDARQMGKSSLMARAAARLRETGTRVAVLDLSELGQNLTVEQWYYGLLMRLGEQLGVEDALLEFWQANKQLGPMQRWMQSLRKVTLDLVRDPVVDRRYQEPRLLDRRAFRRHQGVLQPKGRRP
jgi:hypothetical protein